MTTFTQLTARLKTFLMGWLLVLDLKEGLVECATFCIKSEVILIYAVIMASGLISVVLIYMQIVRPFNPEGKGVNKEEHLLDCKGEHKDLDFPKSKFFI